MVKHYVRCSANICKWPQAREAGFAPPVAAARPADMKQRKPVDNRRSRHQKQEPHGIALRNESSGDNRIFGVLPVLEVLRAGSRRVEKVVFAEGVRESRLGDVMDRCRELSIAWEYAKKDRFPAAKNHQGVYAVVASAEYSEIDAVINAREPALILVLDGVEDPRNLGAAVRVAECAGANGVIIPERRAAGLTDIVSKSSAGALEYVKIARAGNLNRLIEDLKAAGIWAVGASADAEMSYTEWDWRSPSALILGNEGRGLHRLVAENCDVLVKIPMYGKIDSLNVSVAAGVILFEAMRQRRKE